MLEITLPLFKKRRGRVPLDSAWTFENLIEHSRISFGSGKILRELSAGQRQLTESSYVDIQFCGASPGFLLRWSAREGRIRSAERVEAHLLAEKFREPSFSPLCGRRALQGKEFAHVFRFQRSTSPTSRQSQSPTSQEPGQGLAQGRRSQIAH